MTSASVPTEELSSEQACWLEVKYFSRRNDINNDQFVYVYGMCDWESIIPFLVACRKVCYVEEILLLSVVFYCSNTFFSVLAVTRHNPVSSNQTEKRIKKGLLWIAIQFLILEDEIFVGRKNILNTPFWGFPPARWLKSILLRWLAGGSLPDFVR